MTFEEIKKIAEERVESEWKVVKDTNDPDDPANHLTNASNKYQIGKGWVSCEGWYIEFEDVSPQSYHQALTMLIGIQLQRNADSSPVTTGP